VNKELIIEIISTKIKLIRTEKGIRRIKWMKFSAFQRKSLFKSRRGIHR